MFLHPTLRYALRLASILNAAAALPFLGACAPTPSDQATTLSIRNGTTEPAILVYLVDDQEYREAVRAAETRTINIGCPTRVAVRTITWSRGVVSEDWDLSDASRAELRLNEHYACGDKIEVEFNSESSTWRTLP